MSPQIKKRGLSEVVGYVILISIIIAMSSIVYLWMKSYIPAEEMSCPDSISISIIESSCITSDGETNISVLIKNIGRFNVGGFMAYLGYKDEDIASRSIIEYNRYGIKDVAINLPPRLGNTDLNSFKPNDEFLLNFELKKDFDRSQIDFIEIIPLRLESQKGKGNKYLTCSSAKIKQKVSC